MHKIVKCKLCEKIISQCRCFNHDKKVEYIICDECKSNEKEEK